MSSRYLSMNRTAAAALAALLLIAAGGCASVEPQDAQADDGAQEAAAIDPATRVHVSEQSDAQAIEIAQATVAKMGGWEAWDRTRYLSWKFFGRRQHYWDRWTGNIRIEGQQRDGSEFVYLMNIHDREGRAWVGGEEVTEPEDLSQALDGARQMWVNDSYWLIMPFKLLDPGVTLKYAGEQALEDGRAADVLELTFDNVGYTPDNRYHVFVARDSGLVEQWSFFAKAEDTEPNYTLPWTGWQTFGEIKIATVRRVPEEGQPATDWAIIVHEALPDSLFSDPAPLGS